MGPSSDGLEQKREEFTDELHKMAPVSSKKLLKGDWLSALVTRPIGRYKTVSNVNVCL